MEEYIKRETALKILENSLTFSENELDKGDFRKGCISAIKDDIGNIRGIPASDVAEVKHGFWFISEYEYLNCSVCGEAYFTGADSTAEAKERLAEGSYYPYCPHCGAKMDAEPPKKKARKK